MSFAPEGNKVKTHQTPRSTAASSTRKPARCRVGPTDLRSRLRSLAATSGTAGFPAAGQHTEVYLSGPVKRSLDTNSPSHSHALPPRAGAIPPPRWNSSLPSTGSHVTALFRADAQTTSCVSDSHAPMLPSAPRHMTSPGGEKCISFSFFPPLPQHSYHIRRINPANGTKQREFCWSSPACTSPTDRFQQGCVLRLASASQDKTDFATKEKENLSQPFHKICFFFVEP